MTLIALKRRGEERGVQHITGNHLGARPDARREVRGAAREAADLEPARLQGPQQPAARIPGALHFRTRSKLTRLKRDAEHEGAFRVAKRLHAVLLNAEDYTSGTIARILDAPLSKVSEWLRNYERYGYEGLLEGHRSGRPPELSAEHLRAPCRYHRKRAGCLRVSFRCLDLAYAQPCDC